MNTPNNPVTLADWRRRIAEMYARVRSAHNGEPWEAWETFRDTRNDLLRNHPQSPLDSTLQKAFQGLAYFPYDETYRVIGTMRIDTLREHDKMELSREGELHFTKVGKVDFNIADQEASLTIYWINGYGGGIFLPFQDATSGAGTYAGGRYLYDTIKGADLGVDANTILLDFNYAYNPSCAYDEKWVCPLSPKENRLAFAIEAGEKAYTP